MDPIPATINQVSGLSTSGLITHTLGANNVGKFNLPQGMSIGF